MAWRLHDCPYCRCADPGDTTHLVMNTDAPHFRTVLLIDAAVWEQTTAKHRASRARRKADHETPHPDGRRPDGAAGPVRPAVRA